MFQAFQGVKVSDKDEAMFGEAGHVVKQEGDVISVKMDADNEVHEYQYSQLTGL